MTGLTRSGRAQTWARLGAATLLWSLAGTSAARDLSQILQDGTLRVGFVRELPRLNQAAGSRRTGLEVDLVNRFARTLKVKVAWVKSSPGSYSQDLKLGRIDLLLPQNEVLPSVPAPGLALTKPYYCSGAVILSRGTAVRNSTGLLDKRIAVQPGKVYFDYLKRLALDGNSSVQKDATAAVLTLIYKTADVAIVDKLTALDALFLYPKAEFQLSYPLWNTRFAAVTRAQDGQLRDAFNKTLRTLTESGAYDEFSRSYFPQNIRCSAY